MSSPRMDIRNSGSIPKSKYPVIVYIVHKCNDNALTLVISRTPKRLKTSYESTSEKAALKATQDEFKIPFQCPDLQRPLVLLSGAKIRTISEIFTYKLVFSI